MGDMLGGLHRVVLGFIAMPADSESVPVGQFSCRTIISAVYEFFFSSVDASFD